MSAHEVGYLAQSHWHHFRYRIGEMVGLDRTRREVLVAPHVDDEGKQVTPQRAFGYDTLVIAVGSQSNDFGTPGVREHAMRLETSADALRFHSRMVNACIRAHAQDTPVRPEQLHVAIIGAGATGVELAAELHRTTREVVAFGLDRVDADKDIRVAAHRGRAARAAGLAAAPVRGLRRTVAQAWRRGAHERQGGRGRARRRAPGRRAPAAGRTDRLGGRGQGAGLPEGHRRAGDQPHQPAGGAADAADHARRRHLRHRRLRGLCLAAGRPGQGRLRAAARAGRPPAGLAHGRPDQAPARRQAPDGLPLPRFRLAGVAGRVQHRGQHDGRADRRQPDGRRAFSRA